MDKINFPRRFRVYAPLVCLFVALVFLFPKSPKFNFSYTKGSPWMYETLVAKFDFPILKTDAQLIAEREAAASSVVPYYRLDASVAEEIDRNLAEIDFGKWQSVRPVISSTLSSIYSRGVLSNESSSSPIYVQRNKRAEKLPVSEVYTLPQAQALVMTVLKREFPLCNVDSLSASVGLASLLRPDLVYDSQTTELIHEGTVSNISTTMGVVRSGEVIVSNGELVTAEIEQMLNSYKEEYDASVGYSGPRPLMWLGNIVLAFAIILVLFLSIYYCNEKIFGEYNKYLYLLIIFAITVIASCILVRTQQKFFYLVPFTLPALFLLAFFKQRVVFTVYIISLLPMLLFASDGVELFTMYFVAGVVGMLVFGFFNKGWLQFVTALIVFVVMVLVWLAFRMVEGMDALTDYRVIMYMFFAAMLSVAGYPLIFLFEKIFSLVSNSKLVELSDTSNALLRLLADKAPGTFQHSLQVMNLADAAARSIEANVLLVRAGALYHDIGKIANPQCFTEHENQGVNYHQGLTPQESAQEIIRHVSEGLALADKYNLPGIIKDFILTHHGTTCTGYFYTKFLNDGGDPNDAANFRYDGKKPTTKEQVILMLCDGVEAASRSLKDYSQESVSALVDNIMNGKIEENQFTDADITIRELNTVSAEIKTYLMQMYHSRVAYPKRNHRAGR